MNSENLSLLFTLPVVYLNKIKSIFSQDESSACTNMTNQFEKKRKK